MTFSVKLLLCSIALCAIIVSALLGANEKSLRLIATSTLLLCIAAAIFIAAGSPTSRIFALGFLLGCLPYLYVAVGSNGSGRRYLATEVVLENIDYQFHFSEPRTTPIGETVQLLSSGLVRVSTPRGFGRFRSITMTYDQAQQMGHLPFAYKEDLLPSKPTFLLIGHFATALILGIAGGTLAAIINHRTSRRRVSPRLAIEAHDSDQ